MSETEADSTVPPNCPLVIYLIFFLLLLFSGESGLEVAVDLQQTQAHSDRALRPLSLKTVTVWHFCLKVQCQSFQKAFGFPSLQVTVLFSEPCVIQGYGLG